MKKSFVFLTLTGLMFTAFCHADAYDDAMISGIEKLYQSKTNEEYQESANRFERIASMETDQWLPLYYAAYAYIQMSFIEQDLTKKDIILDKAQIILDKALQIAPGESELHVLQALLFPSRILVDPVGRGMLYINKIYESIGKAKSLNPENPRIYFLEAINTLNIPESMGGGVGKAKPVFELAEEKFNSFTPETPISPDWGKEANEAELQKLK